MILRKLALSHLGANIRPNELPVSLGFLSLVAGTATDNIGVGTHGEFALAFVNRLAAGGTIGHLSADYDSATGVLTVTSSSATETSTVSYTVLG